MTARIDYMAVAPEALKILLSQEAYLAQHFADSQTLSVTLWELVKLRISQINQCAFCIDMHTKDALKYGETPERIIGLSAWREMPLYTVNERAALAWAEQLTAAKAASDEMYQHTLAKLGERGIVDLTIAVNAINSWNRIVKAFQPVVGEYQPS
ncbi:carboxymuconolactone decarboxylase family protein [Thaumasiovibrio subtropicus]|uniref:carboxymuconolactone decarboxylase family protein n=1 Tax=Thaumasiovibrio subtropicus TaxID=1891207 RepID=UPI000B35C39F|nr:carboxymuconolactone decarboxylase family protein [Thaumasiovibrio subtropicus]